MVANAQEFLRLATAKRDIVKVRGAEIHIREMTVGDRKRFVQAIESDSTAGAAILVQMCATKPDGSPLFETEQEAADLAKAAPEVVDAVASGVLALSGLEGAGPND